MSERSQLARPIVRRRTGFHADQARRQRLKEHEYFAAPQLATDDDLAARVHAVHLEPVLSDIQTHGGNLHVGRLLSLWRSQTTTLWHTDAGSGGRPPHQALNYAQTPGGVLKSSDLGRLQQGRAAPPRSACRCGPWRREAARLGSRNAVDRRGRKQLISTNTIRPAWRGAAGASSRPRAVQVATASAFSSRIITGRPASRASAIPTFPPHRPSRCCRQGGSPGGGGAKVIPLSKYHSFHVTVGKTSVVQVRSTDAAF
jgi:hypothetical protein